MIRWLRNNLPAERTDRIVSSVALILLGLLLSNASNTPSFIEENPSVVLSVSLVASWLAAWHKKTRALSDILVALTGLLGNILSSGWWYELLYTAITILLFIIWWPERAPEAEANAEPKGEAG